MAMMGLGNVYEKQCKYNEARVVFKSALNICKNQFEEEDPRTARAMERLANVYKKIADTSQDQKKQEKKYAKTEALLREYVLPIYEQKFGENHPRTEKVREKLKDLPVKPGQEMARGTRRLIAERWVNLFLNYIKRHKRFPDICDPKLFNEKQLHRALFDRRPIRTQLQDKYIVREYIKDRIGEKYLPQLLCEPTKDPSTIPFKDLPDKFVIKSNQGGRSSRVILVTDKSTIDESAIIEKCQEWLNNDYYKLTGSARYKNIDQHIMVEEYIDDGKGKAPYDYKFYTYDDKPHYIQVEAGRIEDYSSTFHDTDWNRLPMTHGVGKNCSTPIDKPPHLELMLELAQKLGKGLDFVRIDFYDTPEKVFVGEITSISGSAMEPFEPLMYDRILGEPWKEVYNKCSKPSLPPSSDVFQILSQITCGMHQLNLEGQRNRQYSQKEGLEEPLLVKPEE
jgi:hypothetical protein